MELRYVNPTIKAKIVQMLRDDSRRNLSSISRRLGLDVRIVAGYMELIRREYRFTIIRRPPEEMSTLTPLGVHAASSEA